MKRTFARIPALVAAVAVFAGLVYGVLVTAHLSEPAADTVHGLTVRRLWATASALMALAGVVSGGMAVARRGRRLGSIAALVAGFVAAASGWMNLALAEGGPGTGNGVVGGAAAVVLGMVAMALGGLASARRRTAFEARR